MSGTLACKPEFTSTVVTVVGFYIGVNSAVLPHIAHIHVAVVAVFTFYRRAVMLLKVLLQIPFSYKRRLALWFIAVKSLVGVMLVGMVIPLGPKRKRHITLCTFISFLFMLVHMFFQREGIVEGFITFITVE